MGFFVWINITDFFIVKLPVLWSHFSRQKTGNFTIKKSVILIQTKNPLLYDFNLGQF